MKKANTSMMNMMVMCMPMGHVVSLFAVGILPSYSV